MAPRISLLLAAALSLWCVDARGEVFVFRDGREVRGKVLAAFDEVLYVRSDGGEAGFLHRTELSAILDDEGRPFDAAPGDFSRAAPAGAISDVVGEVRTSQGAVVRPPVFVAVGQTIETGEAAFCRVVLPQGQTCKLSPEGKLTLTADDYAVLRLEHGEATLQATLHALELLLGESVQGTLQAGSSLVLTQDEDTAHLEQISGATLVSSPWVSMTLEGGFGVSLRRLTQGALRVSADPANPGSVVLTASGERVSLEAGASRVVGTGGEPGHALWRVRVAHGEFSVRKGAGPFAAVEAKLRARLVLGAGDAVRTEGNGSVTLSRARDGASVTVESSSSLEVDEVLVFERGPVLVEAVEARVKVALPTGTAALRMAVVRLTHAASDTVVRAGAGQAELPLGPLAALTLDQGGQVRLSMTDDRASLVVEAGRAHVTDAGSQGRFRVTLVRGDEVAVRAHGDVPTLLLPGERALTLEDPAVGARVSFEPMPVCGFPTGAVIELDEGLRLALGVDRERPQLRFVKGPRLTLMDPYRMRVENPTVVLRIPEDREVSVKLEGKDLAARLVNGGRHAVAALGVREADYLEVSGDGAVTLDRRDGLTRFLFADGRKLWIEDGAPPVQSRFADGDGLVYLTMPGVPALGIKGARRVTVLATRDGEFVILDQEQVAGDTVDLERLSGLETEDPVEPINRDPVPDLLDVPTAASPSGP